MFGINHPFEDLYVSPNHGIVARNGRLYPAKKFVNGTTVYQDPTIATMTYYHIKLAGHYVITANGVAAETYRDPGHFSAFQLFKKSVKQRATTQ